MDSFIIKKVHVELIRPLRLQVLRPGQSIESTIFQGDDEFQTTHFAAMSAADSSVMCIASLYLTKDTDGKSWQLRGMATDPARQGSGLGAKVLDACLKFVREQQGHEIWCNARTTACAFYEKAGFTKIGNQFEIAGIGPHFVMKRPV